MTDIITSTAPVAAGFDYSTVSAETAHDLREVVATIRNLQRAAIEDVGRHLIAAKQSVEPGQFQQWCRTELGFEPRTAERCMRAAAFLEGKPSQLTHLPHDIIYKLSAPSAPADVVQAVVDAAASGTPMARTEIDARLADHHQHNRQIDYIVAHSRAKAKPTREQAQARIAREQTERAREQAMEQAKRRQEDERRDARLRPVADQVVAALGDDLLDEVQAILEDRDERYPFLNLLAAAIKAAPPGRSDEAEPEPIGAEIVDTKSIGFAVDNVVTGRVAAAALAPVPARAGHAAVDVVVEVTEPELVAAGASPPVPEPAPAPVQPDLADPTGWRRMANQCLSRGVSLSSADLSMLTAITGLGSSTPTVAQVDRLEILHAGLPPARGGVL